MTRNEEGRMSLLLSAAAKYAIGLALVVALLFLPAGSFGYTNAWLFLGLLFLPMLILGIVLLIKEPDLLRKRLNAKEGENTQRGVVAISGLLFIGGFVVAGLDHRFGWSSVPSWAVIAASVVFLVSYALYAEVMRETRTFRVRLRCKRDKRWSIRDCMAWYDTPCMR